MRVARTCERDAMSRKLRNGRTGGKFGGERFVALPHDVVHAMQQHRISCVARSAIIELSTIYNGSNNGSIAMAARSLAERLHVSKDTAARALKELIDAGFIETTRTADFDGKQRKATEYRLTWRKCDRTGRPASRLYRRQDTPPPVV